MKCFSSSKIKNWGPSKQPLINIFVFQMKYFWMNTSHLSLLDMTWKGKEEILTPLRVVILSNNNNNNNNKTDGGQACFWRTGSEHWDACSSFTFLNCAHSLIVK